MKYIYILLIFITFNGFSQNVSFYEGVPGFPNVQYYNQINTDPYIFKNGILLNESVNPSWYGGLMFHKSPGIFSGVTELYSYLGDDSRFTQNPVKPSTYDHKTDFDNQLRYFELGQSSLTKSLLYSDDTAFLGAVKGDPTELYLRYTIVHRETYLKIDTDEFLVLTYSSMTANYIPTTSEIQKITDYITGDTVFESEIEASRCLAFTILHKENNKWKFLGDGQRAFQFIEDQNLYPALTGLLAYGPDYATVVSTINSSGNRVYVEQ